MINESMKLKKSCVSWKNVLDGIQILIIFIDKFQSIMLRCILANNGADRFEKKITISRKCPNIYAA